MDVDEVLKELVERKTRMQSYSAFNLDAAVAVRLVSFTNKKYNIFDLFIYCFYRNLMMIIQGLWLQVRDLELVEETSRMKMLFIISIKLQERIHHV